MRLLCGLMESWTVGGAKDGGGAIVGNSEEGRCYKQRQILERGVPITSAV